VKKMKGMVVTMRKKGSDVTAQPNLADIVRFGSYCPHGFVLDDHTWLQNTSNKSTISIINKVNY